MDVTPAQRRSFDRRYRWVVLRALEDLRRAPELNLDNLTELSKIYEICRDQSIQLALDEQRDPEKLDVVAVRELVSKISVILARKAGAT